MIESQVNYILQLIQMVERTHIQAVAIKPEVQDQFNASVQQQLQGTVWQSGCVSWYQQDGGKNFSLWPTYTWQFWLQTRKANLNDYQLLGNQKQSAKGSQAA